MLCGWILSYDNHPVFTSKMYQHILSFNNRFWSRLGPRSSSFSIYIFPRSLLFLYVSLYGSAGHFCPFSFSIVHLSLLSCLVVAIPQCSCSFLPMDHLTYEKKKFSVTCFQDSTLKSWRLVEDPSS